MPTRVLREAGLASSPAGRRSLPQWHTRFTGYDQRKMRLAHVGGAWVGLLACTHAFAPPRRPKLRLHSSLRADEPSREPEPEPSRLAAALKPARGPLDKEIAAVALPAMLSLAVFPVVGMVDTFFVGRMGSALSLAGQGAANAAFNFCFLYSPSCQR